jgi:tRNA-binding EMAP/Myf-like protein
VLGLDFLDDYCFVDGKVVKCTEIPETDKLKAYPVKDVFI